MRMRTLPLLGAGVLAVLAAVPGCGGGSSYEYRPDTANVMSAGLPAARTAIPQEEPQGAIEVTSYGITQLRRDQTAIPALHVRATVTNDGDDTPWTLDTTEQLVEISGKGQSRAMYVNSDVGTLPNVTIGKHERRVLDFYFPLPDTIRKESQLPRFELLWQVDTPARTVASRTAFDRVDMAPMVMYDTAPLGWPLWAGYGPYWWYDPFYPTAGFIHTYPRVMRGSGRVMVDRFDGHFRPGRQVHVSPRRR